MLGKLIATILVLGALFFGAVWFFTGQTPSQFIHSITATKTTDNLSTNNAKNLVYSYQVIVGPDKKTYRFNVEVHVVKKTSNQLCYTYQVTSIEQGDPKFIKDFMYGYQGYTRENQTICTNLETSNVDLSMYFTKPSRTGTISLRASNGAGKAYVENGVLRSLNYSYTVDTMGKKTPVQLTISLKENKTQTTTTQRRTSTTQAKSTGNELSSANVKHLDYKFTIKIEKIDIATGKPSGQTTTTSYEIRVDVTKRQGNQVCLKYTITRGDKEAAQLMTQLWPYSPGETRCTTLSSNATQIPYFLFPATMTTTQTFSNGDTKGTATIVNGILKHLEINTAIILEDKTEHTEAPMKIIVELINATK